MTRRWLRQRRQDPFYRKAKREGYRSRASYKLLQLDKKFSLFKPGQTVVDLGCAPGGWSQVAAELVGYDGTVVGVDLAPVEPLEGVTFLRGDMTQRRTVDAVLEASGGEADVVISDMSPNISGAYSTDQARSVHLAEHALVFAEQVLRTGGAFVAKVFEGDLFPNYLARVRRTFRMVKVASPQASRSQSSEVYVVAKGFIEPAAAVVRPEPAWKEGAVIGDDVPLRRRRRTQAEVTSVDDAGTEASGGADATESEYERELLDEEFEDFEDSDEDLEDDLDEHTDGLRDAIADEDDGAGREHGSDASGRG